MYRKNGHLACKNRANGRDGSAGLVGRFWSQLQNFKKSLKYLIFNGLLFWSGFGVVLEFCAILLKTCDNKTIPRINSLIFNAFKHA